MSEERLRTVLKGLAAERLQLLSLRTAPLGGRQAGRQADRRAPAAATRGSAVAASSLQTDRQIEPERLQQRQTEGGGRRAPFLFLKVQIGLFSVGLLHVRDTSPA